MYYKFFVFLFMIAACQESDKSEQNKSANSKSNIAEQQTGQKKIQENLLKKDTVSIRTTRNKTSQPKTLNHQLIQSRSNSTTYKNSTKEIADIKHETQNEYILKKEKWNSFYSEDSNWLELYNASEASFIKGFENEFIKNPELINTINKPFLIQLFNNKMEKIFFNSPSFIQFSVDRFSACQSLDRLQIKWNIPN